MNYGISLLKKYENVPKIIIENHNNIEELRTKPNTEFSNLKRKLIIVSELFLVP